MGRCSVEARAAGAGSATLPVGSIYSTASVNPRLREVGIFNTTSTAVVVGLCRMSTAGTQGAALTEAAHDATGAAPQITAFNTHTVGPTLVSLGYRAHLGAVPGSGVVWTFGGDVGITCAVGTGNGIGIYIPTGTGQVLDWYMVWDE